jgi:hypothetical protein
LRCQQQRRGTGNPTADIHCCLLSLPAL